MRKQYHAVGLAVLAVTLVFAGSSRAQSAPALGDLFIYFHNEINPLIPNTSGLSVTADPLTGNPEVRVVHFYSYTQGYNQAQPGFHWPTSYVDMTANIARGDTLYLRFMSDPLNAIDQPTEPVIRFHFIDAEQLNGDGTANGDNMAMRLAWYIPDEFHDGQWHDVAIPLPPATRAELVAKQNASNLNDLIWGWDYYGAWNSDGNTFIGPDNALFQEFEWDRVQSFGPWWDYAPGNLGGSVTAGPIYVDYMYVGSGRVDLDAGTLPGAVTGVTVSSDEPGVNHITVTTPVADAEAYRVYASVEPITDVTAPGVKRIATIPPTSSSLTVRHTVFAADPNDPRPTVYYAVTSVGSTGVENPDVTQSTASNQLDAVTQPYVFEVVDAQGTLAAFSADEFSLGTFPYQSFEPIVLSGDGTPPEEDMQGRFWVGFSGSEEPHLFVYAEIQDDDLSFAAPSVGAGDAWQYDSFEIVWGTYEVAPIAGSSHGGMGSDDEPDYFVRVNPRVEGGAVTSVTVGGLQQAEAQFDYLTSAEGDTIGYKVFAHIPTAALAGDNAPWTAPAAGQVQFHPFSLIMNDRDAGGRQHNPNWSAQWPGFGTGWWENPSMWRVIAFAGRDYVTTDVEAGADLPAQFSLEQAYPNPFNPATTISFRLESSSHVRLTVHNILGQQVAVLIDGQTLPTGEYTVQFDGSGLSSGTYFYTLRTGSSLQTRSVTLLK